MIAALGTGDCGYFHFSGHGVRMPSTDVAEPDGMDEALCPYEFDWSAATAITDNEVLTVLGSLALGARMIFTFDSCHSGDFSRAPVEGKPRTLRPPPNMSRRGPTRQGFRSAARAPNVSFVSACSPWETAADTSFDGHPNGAFTYYFAKELNANGATSTLTDMVAAISPSLQKYQMTPVAENGDTPYFPAANKTPASRSPMMPLALPVRSLSTRAGTIVFEQHWQASLIGQTADVGVRIVAANGELTTYLIARFMGSVMTSPPIRTAGNMTFPLQLGFFGLRLMLSISDWTYGASSIDFVLQLDLASDLPFVPRVRIVRLPIHIDVSQLGRGLANQTVTSPADLVALLQLAQLSDASSTPRGLDSREPSAIRGFRDPLIQVIDSGVAGWGPNWREDRVIRPFKDRPRPDGVTRHSVDIGPQRGAGNVYVVGWLSDQETDFDFILHMGNGFFGGWGEIDWRVQGIYADINPFPRTAVDTPRVASQSTATNGKSMRKYADDDQPR